MASKVKWRILKKRETIREGDECCLPVWHKTHDVHHRVPANLIYRRRVK